MKIETKRLIIRNFNEFDLEDYFKLNHDEELTYYAGFKPHPDLKTSSHKLKSIMLVNDYFAVTLKDGTLIGDLNYYTDPLRRSSHAFQIGFLLSKEFQGQGYMQEALKAFIEYLYLSHEIEILSCVTMIKNSKAQRTIENLGFQYDGIIRQYKRIYNGELIDCKLYTLTNNEIERKLNLWQKS